MPDENSTTGSGNAGGNGSTNGAGKPVNLRKAGDDAAKKIAGGPNAENNGSDTRSSFERFHDRVDDVSKKLERDEARERERLRDAARHDWNTVDDSTYVPARILWPALGFPAVISPGSNDPAPAARTLCLLVLSNRDPKRFPLSKRDVARHLRIVSWENRRRKRYLREGGAESFREEDIVVRHAEAMSKKGAREGFMDDGRVQLVNLGGISLSEPAGTNGFILGLSTWVRKLYAGELKGFPLPADQRLPYLYEIQIAEHAMERFAPGASGGGGGGGGMMGRVQDAGASLATAQYHVFWVNKGRDDDESDRSEEMHLLIEHYGRNSRFGHDGVRKLEFFVGKQRQWWERKHLREYEYEFGQPDAANHRTEVLHPVFIRRPTGNLRIGHLTDLHVDIRTQKYADEMRKAGEPATKKETDEEVNRRKTLAQAKAGFHDWNEACIKLYAESKQDSDVLFMTGDLIDYGRGYNGEGPMGEDNSYWRDRNWFLFYEFLAAGNKYSVPVYTSLGNHDWRFNPYPAVTFGSPSAKDFGLSKAELKQAHGDGFDKFTYATSLGMAWSFIGKKLWNKFFGGGQLSVARSPLETTVESVAWYLLVMNPFLDYTWRLPGGFHLVMLDWAEGETADLPVIFGGQSRGKNAFPNTYGGPRAKNCVTEVQKELVEHVAGSSAKAKILGIHAPPIGPWGHWKDDELARGRVEYNANDLKAAADELNVVGNKLKLSRVLVNDGPAFEGSPRRVGDTDDEYKSRVEGERADSLHRLRGAEFDGELLAEIVDGRKWGPMAYPTLAIRTRDGELLGREADYGSFDQNREWLINRVRQAKFSVILAGHIHRENVLIIDPAAKDLPPEWRGKWVVRCIKPEQAPKAQAPLFVNTTSAGPLGHSEVSRGRYMVAASGYTHVSVAANGAINKVEFRPDVSMTVTPPNPRSWDQVLQPAGTGT